MSWLETRWYNSLAPAPIFLRPLEALFKCLAGHKKKRDLISQWDAPVPVIVVGNISVGGTGKTPLTVYLVDQLKAQGYKPGIISRGYKSKAPQYPFDVSLAVSSDESGDEPYMLQRRCQCPVVIDADRRSAAEYLLSHYDCDLIISDDGLQHYRLARDIEIAVVDSERGLGNGHCLPAGPLREEPLRLKSVNYVVSNGGECAALPKGVVAYDMQLMPCFFHPCGWNSASSRSYPFNEFPYKKINAVAGIGHPQRFFNTLKSIVGAEVLGYPKPDHYSFSESDFNFADGVTVMTEKDAVKVSTLNLKNAWYLEVSAQLPDSFMSVLIEQLKHIANKKGNKRNG
ncbi:tetraacyldisaccharide 4'-kinase [Neptuniibacter marinus]|uniref:tetraacyldisaccharide 4'-kinase n=1 Tax=Neptuniibacter marinus TaxID=1806670 RepID=UPI00082D5F43|nr:tetraacyldisaccharide 4'-kinase [Neptuniibacter marinus]